MQPLSETVLELLMVQPVPVTAAQVTKLLPARATAREVVAALAALVEAGRVFAFTQGRSQAYTAKPALDLCAEALRREVATLESAAAPARLRTALPKSLQPWFDEALGRLIVQGHAHWLPKGKSRLVLPRRVRPSDVIPPSLLAPVQHLLTVAGRYRASACTMADFLAWLDGTDAMAPGEVAEPSVKQLTDWYRDDLALSSSSMVPIPQTFARYQAWAVANHMQADEAVFRLALEALYKAGQAILEPCERPQDLPAQEQRLQVPLTFGPPGYYWSPVG